MGPGGGLKRKRIGRWALGIDQAKNVKMEGRGKRAKSRKHLLKHLMKHLKKLKLKHLLKHLKKWLTNLEKHLSMKRWLNLYWSTP